MSNFDNDFKDFQPNTSFLSALGHNSENLEKLGIDSAEVDDTVFGAKFVYCGSHHTAHSTGWCSVSVAAKRPLNAETKEEAFAEVSALGFS
jgi:hypothetical protein